MGQVALNTIIMIAFVTLVIRLTGKRQIGELQIGELVVTFMISDLASLPMQNPEDDVKLTSSSAFFDNITETVEGLSFTDVKIISDVIMV